MGAKRKVSWASIKNRIDDVWKSEHRPPSLREISSWCGVSLSHVFYIVRNLDGVSVRGGKVFPQWVDEMFKQQDSRKGNYE